MDVTVGLPQRFGPHIFVAVPGAAAVRLRQHRTNRVWDDYIFSQPADPVRAQLPHAANSNRLRPLLPRLHLGVYYYVADQLPDGDQVLSICREPDDGNRTSRARAGIVEDWLWISHSQGPFAKAMRLTFCALNTCLSDRHRALKLL